MSDHQTQILSKQAEEMIVSSFDHYMEQISNCIGGRGYYLHDDIVEAVKDAVESGVYRATKEYLEGRRLP